MVSKEIWRPNLLLSGAPYGPRRENFFRVEGLEPSEPEPGAQIDLLAGNRGEGPRVSKKNTSILYILDEVLRYKG